MFPLIRDNTVHTRRLPDRDTAEIAPGDEAAMMRRLAEDASHIFLACGATNFRKQISGLVSIFRVSNLGQKYLVW